jgi:hypothetical protein
MQTAMRHRNRWTAKTAWWAGALLASNAAFAQDRDPMVLHNSDGLTVRAHIEAGLNAVAEQSLFWDLARTTAPQANFDPNKQWLEGYFKPGVSFTRQFGDSLIGYGKLSGVASGTLATDAFDAGNIGRATLEEGYLGLRSGDTSGRWFDVSVGPREFKAGTGMLLANGGTSGFERGALKLGPRKAWEFAALGRVGYGGFSATAFYLDPNEVPSSNSFTKIVGSDLRYDGASNTFAGVTVGHVLDSSVPYPKVAPGGIGPPNILPNARDGLNFANLYWRANPFRGALENLFVSADYAYEWNPAIDLKAWGGRVQVGYVFAGVRWTPTLTYSYQTFSGDNPTTSKLERFDPLYFEGTPSSWSTGSKSSMVFINSNVNAHQISLRITPTERDTLTLRYTFINANQLASPLQFGQATRIVADGDNPAVIAGVISKHLSDDIFLEYTRQLNRNTYLTAGYSVSFPGKGITSITTDKMPTWTGGFVNVVVNF